MPTIHIVPVKCRELLFDPDAAPLFREYAAECSIPELGAISPQRDIYEAMEKNGVAHFFGAYDGVHLVGFAVMLIYILPHYGSKVATTESLFLAKLSRGWGNGVSLMKYLENYARERDCKAFLYTAPRGGRLARLLSLFKEYRRTNDVFLRQLN